MATTKPFVHRKDSFNFTELKTENKDDRRFYITPDGAAYPSITTVLKLLTHKSIMEWRKRVGDDVANAVSAKASRRGTAVHYMCEDYINNLDPLHKERMPADIETFKSIKPVIDEHINNIYAQEIPLYSNYLKLAGRVDCVAEWDGKLAIIDFKTSRKVKKKEWIDNYFMQAAGYAVMFEEITKTPITKLVILIAVDENPPQVFVEHRDNYIGKLIATRKNYEELYGI